MNKDLLNSLPADEQPVASKLNTLVDELQLSPSFQEELEMKLMDTSIKKTPAARGWQAKLLPALAWTVVALGAVLLLNWTVRSMATPAPAATPVPVPSFKESVRQGRICSGPLALGHGFAVFLTNDDKTAFIPLDPEKNIMEMRSFAWSNDGSRLAVLGNTPSGGNIWLADPTGSPLKPVLSNSGLGYLMDSAWSPDGKQFVLWSSRNNQVVYLLNVDGSGMVEKQVDLHILGTPQFTLDGKSIIFYGSGQDTAGLFELELENSQVKLIDPSVKDPSGYAFSPDGTLLAYLEYDRDLGEARLVTEDLATGKRTTLGTMPIPGAAGASLPEAANLSWSADGKVLVFDFGQYASQRAIYLAPADGSGLIKLVEPGYAPAISGDGRCLAYIKENQIFLLDLRNTTPSSTPETPLLIGDLPVGRGNPNLKQDKLRWRP